MDVEWFCFWGKKTTIISNCGQPCPTLLTGGIYEVGTDVMCMFTKQCNNVANMNYTYRQAESRSPCYQTTHHKEIKMCYFQETLINNIFRCSTDGNKSFALIFIPRNTKKNIYCTLKGQWASFPFVAQYSIEIRTPCCLDLQSYQYAFVNTVICSLKLLIMQPFVGLRNFRNPLWEISLGMFLSTV